MPEDKVIDVYAYAITLFETLNRREAWQKMTFNELQQVVREGEKCFSFKEIKDLALYL